MTSSHDSHDSHDHHGATDAATGPAGDGAAAPLPHIRWIVVDVPEVASAERFWGPLLHVSALRRTEQYVWFDRPLPEAPGLVLQRVPEPKQGKARVHIDLESEDPWTTITHAEQLGARRLFHDVGADHELAVLADPWGNEFCVIIHGSAPTRSQPGA